jgi:hypothetical protein
MKSKITSILVIFSTLLVNAQVKFVEQVVIDSALQLESPQSVKSADLDGDGDLDVLASSYFDNRFVWFENLDGKSNDVKLHTISSTINTPWGVDAGDLDNDGDMDVVVASVFGSIIMWYENLDGKGTFVEKKTISAYKVSKIKAVDVDNDGDLDLVWLSSTTDVEMMWNKNIDGLGTFSHSFDIENNVSSITDFYPSDIDGDGALDIVSTFSISGQGGSKGVTWYKNTNDGVHFENRLLISDAVGYVTSVYAGDLDGDGDMDVISGSSGENKIAWYENLDGKGTFGPQQILSLTEDAPIVRIVDVDGDSDMDVIFGSRVDKTIGWFKNKDGLGNFSNKIFIAPHSGDIRDIDFSDIDKDGDLDFLTVTSVDNSIKLYKNTDGSGNFASNILTKYIDGGQIVVSEDLDGDGDKDIIAASSWDDKISWFENIDGKGNFYNSQSIISDAINGTTSVFVGDVDGDGFKDVLATSSLDNYVVWFKNIDGLCTFSAPKYIDTNLYRATRVYLSDIDKDGDMDIFALGIDTITWYKNLDGSGNFSSKQKIDTIFNFQMRDMDFADLDSDGDIDISVAGSYGMLRYFNLNGQGTFGTRQILENSTYRPVSTKIADIDADGDNDLVYIGTIGNTSSTPFLGWSKNLNGLGNFGPIQIISTLVSNPTSVIVADFDNDSDIDLASSSTDDGGLIAWYQNTNGKGAFSNTQQIISQNSDPYYIFATDIDNNKTLDIVSISYYDDKISLHKNLGIKSSNSISGNVRFDLSGDGCNENDGLLSGILLVAEDSAGTNASFSQENGQFQIYTTQENLVTTKVTSQLPTYYKANPGSFESNFTGLGNNDNVNFCIAPIDKINDLSVSFYPMSNDPRPGFMTMYRIVYKNRGTTKLSGSISFKFDNSKLKFLNATEKIASQTTNTLNFDFVDLNPFETKTIDLRFNVFTPPTANIGDVLITEATINPIRDDYNQEDNVFHYRQVVEGSFDPNDVTCLEGNQLLIEDKDKYLHYLIRFQNTGTAEAIDIRVENVLDDKLDWTTLQLESLSHNANVTISNGSKASFVFNNINLPDSTNDEPNSHGFIAYKIKPKNNVVVGNIIKATAGIYFDFNPPIVTNTASTILTQTLSLVDLEIDKMSVYPNPTNGFLNIISNVSITNIDIYNQIGQLILSVKDTSMIDIASLSRGVYRLSLKDVSGKSFSKIIIKN